MLYVDDAFLRQRWLQFWNKENHDRPIMSIAVPRQPALAPVPPPASLTEKWEDESYVLAAFRREMENTLFFGEAFPAFNPNLGPDILGAVAGCKLVYGQDTSWAEPCVTAWETHPPLRFDPESHWMKKLESLTKAAVADANGDYLIGITDLHPGSDGLVSLRGPQELCYDTLDCREQFMPRCRELFTIYREMLEAQARILSPVQEGYTNWMGIWHPEQRWYVVGSDFSCMLSQEDYEELVLPALQQELDFLPHSMYHLDGPDALRHLDRILTLEKLDGVQWVYGAGQPSARHWIHVLQAIQNAGKLIQVHCTCDDVLPVCQALRPEGVHLVVDDCATPEHARQLLVAAARR